MKPRPQKLRPMRLKLSQVKIRRATASDRGPILDICKRIWNGGDYVPEVWDDWLRDGSGLLVVATVNETPVGVAHAGFQTRDVAWLEGVRVHEDYRGLGIAGKLNRALVKFARERGARVARLCTGSSNLASRKHLRKVGFNVLQTFQRMDSVRGVGRRPSRVIRPKQSRSGLWNWLSSSPEFVENRAMYSDGWTWYPLTATVFKDHLSEGRVLLTVAKKGPSSCCIFLDDDRMLTLGFAAGELDDVVRVARFLRFKLSGGRYRKVRILLPAKSPLVRALKDAGFEKTAKVLVYEKFLG